MSSSDTGDRHGCGPERPCRIGSFRSAAARGAAPRRTILAHFENARPSSPWPAFAGPEESLEPKSSQAIEERSDADSKSPRCGSLWYKQILVGTDGEGQEAVRRLCLRLLRRHNRVFCGLGHSELHNLLRGDFDRSEER